MLRILLLLLLQAAYKVPEELVSGKVGEHELAATPLIFLSDFILAEDGQAFVHAVEKFDVLSI